MYRWIKRLCCTPSSAVPDHKIEERIGTPMATAWRAAIACSTVIMYIYSNALALSQLAAWMRAACSTCCQMASRLPDGMPSVAK